MAPRPKPLPLASLHIVLALLDGELHGYALMNRMDELTDGAVRMTPGTLYGTLTRLVDEGLIEESTDLAPRDDVQRRRYYRLKARGRRAAIEELERMQAVLHRMEHHIPVPPTR